MFGIFVHYSTRPIYDVSMNLFCWSPSVDIFNILPGFLWQPLFKLYSIVHVAMETTKTSNFTSQSKSFISIFFTCQVSDCELQPFCCHDLANDIYLQTAKPKFSHLKKDTCSFRFIATLPHSISLRNCFTRSRQPDLFAHGGKTINASL